MRSAPLLMKSALLAVMTSACHPMPAAVKTEPAKPNELKNGVAYFLPKRVLQARITYTVEQSVATINGVATKPTAPVARIVKPIVITPTLIPDPAARFVLTGDDVAKRSLLESNLQFAVDDNGLLQSLDADVKDKTLDLVGSLVSGVIGTAKLVAAAGSGIDPRIKPVVERIDVIYAELGNAPAGTGSVANGGAEKSSNEDPFGSKPPVTSAQPSPKPASPATKAQKNNASAVPAKQAASNPSNERIAELKTELAALQDVVDTFVKHNATTTTTSEVEYTTTVDPDSCASSGDDLICTIQPKGLVVNGSAPVGLPEAKLVLAGAAAAKKQATDTLAAALKDSTKGLVHRSSLPIRTSVSIADADTAVEVFSQFVSYPQYGMVETLDVNSKRFAQSKTNVAFGGSGGIKTVKVEAGSSADKLAAQVATSLDSLQKSMNDIRFKAETDALEAEKKLLDARKALQAPTDVQAQINELTKQKELIDAQTALEKARQALEAAQKSGGSAGSQ